MSTPTLPQSECLCLMHALQFKVPGATSAIITNGVAQLDTALCSSNIV